LSSRPGEEGEPRKKETLPDAAIPAEETESDWEERSEGGWEEAAIAAQEPEVEGQGPEGGVTASGGSSGGSKPSGGIPEGGMETCVLREARPGSAASERWPDSRSGGGSAGSPACSKGERLLNAGKSPSRHTWLSTLGIVWKTGIPKSIGRRQILRDSCGVMYLYQGCQL
jgi:hypothetical protein